MTQRKPGQSAEHLRLLENASKEVPIERWGSYLSDRQWGTVREDYSASGDPWSFLTHDHARSKAYRWSEDGLGGICDRGQFICFAFAFWNGKDPILKERLFGLTNQEGNHGEDCKELYYFLDNLPTHSYMKFLYKYPQREFPYADLVQTNAARSKLEKEYELLDTGIFDEGKYFDITIEYAKSGPEDICIKLTIKNHSTEAAPITILPTVWFRNTWQVRPNARRPVITIPDGNDVNAAVIDHQVIGKYHFYFDDAASRNLFTENESNTQRLYNQPNDHPYKKDAFHEVIVGGNSSLLEGKTSGTKFAPMYELEVAGSDTRE
ncbi:MAG TPA: hypothetical protein VLC28_11670, partial [Flavitalea sp.]|nr:hypothetical protein [Flavitalea sp.]